MTIERVIIEPVVTEKTNIMRERHQFTFRVDPRANKIEDCQLQFQDIRISIRFCEAKYPLLVDDGNVVDQAFLVNLKPINKDTRHKRLNTLMNALF